MLRLWQVIMFAPLVAACAHPDECTSTVGVDYSPPELVLRAMKKDGHSDYQLIDRLTCKDKIFWIAIPANIPPSSPRPPGFGFMVTLDIAAEKVEILKGP